MEIVGITNGVCGECIYYTGEECGGYTHEGNEVYDDTVACGDFEPREE